MAIFNELSIVFDDFGGTLCAVADVAEVIRNAPGVEVNVCPFVHAATRWVVWGPGQYCATCALPVLPAMYWHKILVDLLRATVDRSHVVEAQPNHRTGSGGEEPAAAVV